MANHTNEQNLSLQQQEFEKKLDERIASDNLPVANIMVAGITGVGKSTLLSSVFGDNYTEKTAIRHLNKWVDECSCMDVPLRLLETTGLEFEIRAEDVFLDIQKGITECFIGRESTTLHAIWFCLLGNYFRVPQYVFDFVRELYLTKVPLVIVLTQCVEDEEKTNEFESELKKCFATMGLDNIRIVQVLAEPVKYEGMTEPVLSFGLDMLVNLTLDVIPQNIKQSFLSAQKII